MGIPCSEILGPPLVPARLGGLGRKAGKPPVGAQSRGAASLHGRRLWSAQRPLTVAGSLVPCGVDATCTQVIARSQNKSSSRVSRTQPISTLTS